MNSHAVRIGGEKGKEKKTPVASMGFTLKPTDLAQSGASSPFNLTSCL